MLELNDTQESSLNLVFHFADRQGLSLLDLKDLRAVIQYLTSDEGKADLKELGGLSAATAGVILRDLIGLADQGGDQFFGEPEFETTDLLRTGPDGHGVISSVELTNLQDRPQLFSTFLMWLLADLFHELPEVGDLDKPKLVFFFDEAHLLFNGASKAFLDAVTQTVRLIRSKGVGIFFVTQNPQDVPDAVLGQLGNRVQHALRAFTPDDAAALKKAVRTYPQTADYTLEEDLQKLGTGEAIITVLSESGAPTPVAWARMRAPRSLMGQIDAAAQTQAVQASPLFDKYGQPIDRESAYEKLNARLAAPHRSGRLGPTARRRGSGPGAETGAEAEAGQAPGLGGGEGAQVLGVQVLRPVDRHRPGPRDHPQHLRHPPALTRARRRAELRLRSVHRAGPCADGRVRVRGGRTRERIGRCPRSVTATSTGSGSARTRGSRRAPWCAREPRSGPARCR